MSAGRLHPLAEVFPGMSAAELDELAADIRANGLREPIWRHRDGRIIDGRHRWLACERAGVDCPSRTFEGADSELLAFVLSQNLRRRHLNESQRAMVAARFATLKRGSNRFSRVDGEIPSSTEAAQMLNVHRTTVSAARVVRQHGAPELVAAVERGEVAVSRAAKIAKRPKAEQKALLKAKPRVLKKGEHVLNPRVPAVLPEHVQRQLQPKPVNVKRDVEGRAEQFCHLINRMAEVVDVYGPEQLFEGMPRELHKNLRMSLAKAARLLNGVASLWQEFQAAAEPPADRPNGEGQADV